MSLWHCMASAAVGKGGSGRGGVGGDHRAPAALLAADRALARPDFKCCASAHVMLCTVRVLARVRRAPPGGSVSDLDVRDRPGGPPRA